MPRLIKRTVPDVKAVVERAIFDARERLAALRKPEGRTNYAYRIRKTDPPVYHDFSPENIDRRFMAVKMLKDVGGVGLAGEIAVVKRLVYRNYLLETDSVVPVPTHEACFEHPDLMQNLDMREDMVPDCTEETVLDATEQAKKVLERGVKINISTLAKEDWVLTKYHLSKIIAFRTGFDICHENIVMDDFFEIRSVGDYKVRFVCSNNGVQIECDIPVKVVRV